MILERFRTGLIVAVTAILTFLLTSAFWLVTISLGSDADIGEPRTSQGTLALPAARSQEVVRPGRLVRGPTGLAVPVMGVSAKQLSDTYTDSRGGGARVHNAIDIMAPHGTPVLAAAPGKVEKLFFSQGGGGISAYVRSPDGLWIYYYAHLQEYAPGLAEGQDLRLGQLVGRVGSTGNANPAGPHLHFGIHRMATGEPWHQGTPINPYPLLAGN